MNDEIIIGTGTPPIKEKPTNPNEELKDLIEQLCYGQIGAPIYEKIAGPTIISESHQPGENSTSLSSRDTSTHRYLGVILPYSDPESQIDKQYVLLGIDGSALLIRSYAHTEVEFKTEGLGKEIDLKDPSNKNRLIASVASSGSIDRILCDVTKEPDRMVNIIGQAVEQAKQVKQQQLANLQTAKPGIISQLRKLTG